MSRESSTNAGAGRPRSEEKHEAILEAAGNLFLSHGPQATSMDAIAKMANVSKQTVYSHFGDKESLFAACIETKVRRYRVADLPELAGVPLPQALGEVAKRFMDLLMDPGVVSMFRVVIGASNASPEIGALFYAQGPKRTTDALARLLDHHVACGALRCEDTFEAATIFVDLLAASLQRRLLLGVGERPDAEHAAEHIERTVQRFLAMFAFRG